MRVISGIDEIKKIRTNSGISYLGLVPTMGALHSGHVSLVRKAIERCPIVVVSIYVNPTQFNNKEDLRNYPRTIEKDLALLDTVLRPSDIVFTPNDKEMYPEDDKRIFNFGNLDKVMEGLHRPGHFNGVAQIVSSLFSIIDPDIAFFGQKDFQQLTIIKELVRQTGRGPEIISCEIIREKDGLAMSSRNQLLKPEIRKKAGIIYSTISKAALMIKEKEVPEIKKFVSRNIDHIEEFKTEYFEIVDDEKLIPVANRKQMIKPSKYFGCIAVYAGTIRLIDNIEISLD
jgi:pantoate--beta-alanine ligase